MATIALSCYIFFSNKYDHAYGRTIAFNALVVMQWASAFAARSDYQSVFTRLKVMNWPFYIGLLIAISLQLLALFGPLSTILYVSPVALSDLAITGSIGFVSLIAVTEIHKFISRNFFKKGSHHLVGNNNPNLV